MSGRGRLRFAAVALLAAGLLAPPAAAREVFGPLKEAGDHAAYLLAGADRAPLLSVGYGRSVAVPVLPRQVTLVGDLGLPVFISPLRNLRATVAARVLVLRASPRGWNLLNRVEARVVTTQNYVHDSFSVGLGDSVLGGYFGQRWFVAGELGYYRSLSTYLKHSDAYTEMHSGARDGWYRSMGGGFSAGLQAGWTPGLGVELGLRLVAERTERFNAPTGLPFTLTVGAAYHI